MAVPVSQMYRVASYVLTQKLKGVKRYPLVLMLEPLFRCNLACAGCGKIQYPDHGGDGRRRPGHLARHIQEHVGQYAETDQEEVNDATSAKVKGPVHGPGNRRSDEGHRRSALARDQPHRRVHGG